MKRALKAGGTRALDRRTRVSKALDQWRDQLVSDLGGSEQISIQQRAIINVAVKTKLLLDTVDAWLLQQPSLINLRKRAVHPAIIQRQQLADSLIRAMGQLGLERKAKILPSLSDYLNATGKPKSRPAPVPRTCRYTGAQPRRIRDQPEWRKRGDTVNIIQAIEDEHLFRQLFKSPDTWRAWVTVLRAVFGLPMAEEDLPLFKQLTGRDTPPIQQVQECWLVVGRRGGKSFIVALIAVFLACFRDYRPLLGPGERGVLMVIATDRKRARVIMRYLTALLQAVPMLAAMIERQDSESIDLNNQVSIEITTASYRTIRGYTVVAALCDEIAFWRSEDSANPAEEILAALRPAMSTIPGALLIGLGTPYKRSGPLYDAYRRHYGQTESPVLVVQADTRTMNPTVSQSVIDRAMESDPVAAHAEYLAVFRSDVGSFLDANLIERAIEPGRRERAPLPGMSYQAFVDPSGGQHDSFTLAIGHRYGDRHVVDVVRGIKPPFDPSSVVKEFCALLKQYRLSSVVGDKYSGQWVMEAFRKEGVTYKHAEFTKSELYLESLPLFSQGVVDLLDSQPLTVELMQLERRTARSGRDSIDHPPGGRDDLANACCGALTLLATKTRKGVRAINFITGREVFSEEEQLLRREAAQRGMSVDTLRHLRA